MKNRWVVDIKDHRQHRSFEIALVRADYEHGFKSYGWIGERKLLIVSSGGPCQYPIHPLVWDKQVQLAHELAELLNAQEAKQQ